MHELATTVDRTNCGRAARRSSPRSGHAVLHACGSRADPVDLLETQAAERIPELVPVRYGRMASSRLAFFRGAALVMARDLAGTPHSGIPVQLCGDANVTNFAGFATPERHLVFDVNDFDETCPGPWEWDVKRLAASLCIAGRDKGFDADTRARTVAACVARYRLTMHRLAQRRNLEVWYEHADADLLRSAYAADLGAQRRLDGVLARAHTRDNAEAVARLTEVVGGHRRFRSEPPLLVPARELLPRTERDHLELCMHRLLRTYVDTIGSDRRHLLEQFHLADIARYVDGVGAVGSREWVVLLIGKDEHDPLFLQVKQARQSVIAPATGLNRFDNQGERVVVGQRLMQAVSDVFLGWHRVTTEDCGSTGCTPADYYVRQLRDRKVSAVIERMTAPDLSVYGELCGWTLARAHARSGDRIAIAGYLGSSATFDNALVAFAEAYADQNERDHLRLCAAIDSGRVNAEFGV